MRPLCQHLQFCWLRGLLLLSLSLSSFAFANCQDEVLPLPTDPKLKISLVLDHFSDTFEKEWGDLDRQRISAEVERKLSRRKVLNRREVALIVRAIFASYDEKGLKSLLPKDHARIGKVYLEGEDFARRRGDVLHEKTEGQIARPSARNTLGWRSLRALLYSASVNAITLSLGLGAWHPPNIHLEDLLPIEQSLREEISQGRLQSARDKLHAKAAHRSLRIPHGIYRGLRSAYVCAALCLTPWLVYKHGDELNFLSKNIYLSLFPEAVASFEEQTYDPKAVVEYELSAWQSAQEKPPTESEIAAKRAFFEQLEREGVFRIYPIPNDALR
jgi:hypothetical protein